MRRTPRAAVVLCGLIVVVLALAAVAPGLFTSVSPIEADPVNALRPPGGGHWLGTDELGRDVFSRVVHGARSSLSVGLGAILVAVTAGALLGIAAALGGGVADTVLMRLADVLLSLPELMIALLVIAVLGPGTGNTMIAIAVSLVPGYARMVRAEALVVRRSGYVEAAVGLGLPRPVLIARHVLPNALGPLLVLATVGFGTAIIAVSGLSFLGLGARPPAPEWGTMLSSGRKFLAVAWWTAVFPGAAITLAVVSVNVVGRRLQAAFTKRTSA
ncbi:ABC transporter permease [Actinosynnema sp. NPDC020468]|uniref:ABC transporter permease n=1 Tax=Actinosynnema sp. NPDC020468 TaxID=3154488 RepID=UPI0033E6E8BC